MPAFSGVLKDGQIAQAPNVIDRLIESGDLTE
jgi:hypothetical protein